jgi:hypothetical protein
LIKSGVKLKKLKVVSQLRVEMYKLRTNNQNEKDGHLRGSQLSFVEVKLNEIKSLKIIMGSIKRN